MSDDAGAALQVEPADPAATPATLSKSIQQSLSDVPTVVYALIPLGLVCLRIIRVAHGNYTTELALIEQSKTTDVIFGSLAPVVPYLVMYLTVGVLIVAIDQVLRAKSGRAQVDENARTADSLRTTWIYTAAAFVVVLVVLVSTSLGELMFAALSVIVVFAVGCLIYVGLLRLVDGKGKVRAGLRNGRWPVTVLLGALGAFVLFQLGLDDSMWSPPEVVTVQGTDHLVYALDETDQSVLAMNASDRLLIRFPPSALVSSQACAQPHGFLPLERQLRGWPSLLQIVGAEPENHQTTCTFLLTKHAS